MGGTLYGWGRAAEAAADEKERSCGMPRDV